MTENIIYPPSPKQKYPGENLILFQRDPISFLQRLSSYADDGFSYFNIGKTDFYLVNKPEYIREILVTRNRDFVRGRGFEQLKRMLGEGLLTTEGETHLKERRLTQPAFHRQRIASYAETMVKYAKQTNQSWHNGQELDMFQEMMRMTMMIVAEALLGTNVESESYEIAEALNQSRGNFRTRTLPIIGPLVSNLRFLPSNKRFRAAKTRVDQTIYRIINERRASGEDKGDLLSMLLEAQDSEGDGSRMSNKQVRDEVTTLFIAGHETAANTLTWAWYLLSQNPQAVEALHAELDEVLGGRAPTFEDVPNLKYTEKVITEVMRVRPPAWIVGRQAAKTTLLGKYTIPAGANIFVSQYLMHRNPEFYVEPEKFKPERWTPEFKAQLPKFAYFPFGGGPHLCIGEPFAWMEAQLALATLAQKWQPRLDPNAHVAMQPLVTLRPKNGMPMILEQRKAQVRQLTAV